MQTQIHHYNHVLVNEVYIIGVSVSEPTVERSMSILSCLVHPFVVHAVNHLLLLFCVFLHHALIPNDTQPASDLARFKHG